MRKYISICYIITIALLTSCTLNSEKYSLSEENNSNNIITITADYSSYCNNANDLVFARDISVYSDSQLQNLLNLTENRKITGTEITYTFESDESINNIYIVSPTILIERRIDNQTIIIQEGENDNNNNISVKHITVQVADGWDTLNSAQLQYEIVVELESPSGEYPEGMSLISNKQYYIGSISATFEKQNSIPTSCFYSYPIGSREEDAYEILENAYLSYSSLSKYQYASDVAFTCGEDMNINIVKYES